MNLIELFHESFASRPNKKALCFENHWFTFRDLEHRANAVAFALSTRYGIHSGDRIAMYLGNGPDLIAFYLGGHASLCIRSAPLSPEIFCRFKQVFGHEILERYGMSETAIITSNPYRGPRVQGAVGKPLPGWLFGLLMRRPSRE